jgi:hypothetical protein
MLRPTRLNKWVKGRLLPQREDYGSLSQLGLPRAQIHALVVHDRMSALALDEDMDDAALVKMAAGIAHLGGMSKKGLIQLLRETDLEELERALGSF